jgi:hypothetical protein
MYWVGGVDPTSANGAKGDSPGQRPGYSGRHEPLSAESALGVTGAIEFHDFHPFALSALKNLQLRFPRALPWAITFRAVGAKQENFWREKS